MDIPLFTIPLLLVLPFIMQSDLRERRIPNRYLQLTLLSGALIYLLFPEGSLPELLTGGLIAGLLMAGLRWSGNRLLRRESMGWGDVKFSATIGCFSGFPELLLILFLASALALFVIAAARLAGKNLHGEYIPLGFYLAIATAAVLLSGYSLPQFLLNV